MRKTGEGGQALPPEVLDGALESPQTWASSGSLSCPAPLGLRTPGLLGVLGLSCLMGP